MKILISFLLFNLLYVATLFAQTNTEMFGDTFGDEDRVEGVGFIFKQKDGYIRILLDEKNFKEGYYYKGTHKEGEYTQRYINTIHITAKFSNKYYSYTPSIERCEFEFKIIKINSQTQRATVRFSASLVDSKRNLKKILAKEYKIDAKEFIKLKKEKTKQKPTKVNHFAIKYQTLTNKLRKKLALYKIKLLRGDIKTDKTSTVIRFKTDTKVEVTMNTDENSYVTSLKINFKNISQKKDIIKFISSTISVLDNQNKSQELYESSANKLLEGKINAYKTKDAKHTINSQKLYEVLPIK